MTYHKTKYTIKRKTVTSLFSIVAIFSFFLMLGFIFRFIFASVNNSNADSTATASSSAYSASISVGDTNVNIPITPTSTQSIYSQTQNLTFSNTCTEGATVYISTDSSSNALTRTGSDSLTKNLDATTGTSLKDNTWGFSKDSGTTYNPVPVLASPEILYSSSAVENNKTIPVTFGVKTDNNLPSGAYTNNVLYTLVVNQNCLTYTLKFDLDGGAGATSKSYADRTLSYGDTIDLSGYEPTKSGYTFAGWNNGTTTFTDFSSAINPNPSNANTNPQ